MVLYALPMRNESDKKVITLTKDFLVNVITSLVKIYAEDGDLLRSYCTNLTIGSRRPRSQRV